MGDCVESNPRSPFDSGMNSPNNPQCPQTRLDSGINTPSDSIACPRSRFDSGIGSISSLPERPRSRYDSSGMGSTSVLEEDEFITSQMSMDSGLELSIEDLDDTSFIQDMGAAKRPVGTVDPELFWSYAGEDHVIDARDLRDIINELSKKEFGETTTFGIEACRSLIAMSDRYQTGVLDYEEMVRLWDEIILWQKIFKKYDRDRAGCIETFQLKNVLKEIGITLSLDTISCLATRYGGKDRTLFFEDFTLCLARTMSLFTAFKEYSQSTPGEARLNIDQWLTATRFL